MSQKDVVLKRRAFGTCVSFTLSWKVIHETLKAVFVHLEKATKYVSNIFF